MRSIAPKVVEHVAACQHCLQLVTPHLEAQRDSDEMNVDAVVGDQPAAVCGSTGYSVVVPLKASPGGASGAGEAAPRRAGPTAGRCRMTADEAVAMVVDVAPGRRRPTPDQVEQVRRLYGVVPPEAPAPSAVIGEAQRLRLMYVGAGWEMEVTVWADAIEVFARRPFSESGFFGPLEEVTGELVGALRDMATAAAL